MGVQVSALSVAEIRRRFLDEQQRLTPQLLGRLKRDQRRGVRQLYDVLRRRYERDREERLRLDAMLNFERLLWRSGVTRIAGVDEVGMGPLAGPVVAAAVVFPPGTEIASVDDSKRLDPRRRLELAGQIRERAAAVGIGLAEVEEIDRLNIHQAGLLAMRRAIESLREPPEHVLVDARTIPGVSPPQSAFQKGDGINFSIAAASIVAKTHRDRLMEAYHDRYPGYGFARHKGYATREHQRAITRLGPCEIHRSFTFIEELQGAYSRLFYQLKRDLLAARAADGLERVEERIASCREELDPREQRKLRLLLARRWRAL